MNEVMNIMKTAKERLLMIIDEIPEQEANKIFDFSEYPKRKKFIRIFNKSERK